MKTAIVAETAAINLLQATGLLPRELGVLRLEKPTSHIPTGAELRELFDRTTVSEDEITSEAEKAWLYGDLAAATDAKH